MPGWRVALFLVSYMIINLHVAAQSTATESMMHDYPKLMEIYGKQLEFRHAHYIFAVDVSSSMQPYESVVKKNFETFIKAIPDGDQVTLVRMAREDYTDYVGLFKCITINQSTRKSLLEVLDSPQFKFLKDGDPKNGSDGYTMTKKILQAINTVGSSDLTFIYLFTDFEYWTSKYHFDKSKEDWKVLKSQLSEDRKFALSKYGLELNFNDPLLRQQAIFKDELDEIFGKIDYQAVSSAAVLEQWFSHTITNVMSAKIHSMVKKDWACFNDSLVTDVVACGNKIVLRTNAISTPLATGIKASIQSPNPNFNALPEEICSFGEDILMGNLSNPDKGFMPAYKELGEGQVTLSISIDSPVEQEINKLGSILGEKGDIRFSYSTPVDMPSCKVWNSQIPLWSWIVIVVIFVICIGSILYTLFVLKVKRAWAITVVEKQVDGKSKRINGDTNELPYSIGRNGTLAVPGANWELVITSKKYNPLCFWHKSGFYIRLEDGTFAEIIDAYSKETKNTLSVGNEAFLFSCGNPEMLSILISHNGVNYSIELN